MALPYNCKYKERARRALVSYSMVSFALGMFVGVALCHYVVEHAKDTGNLDHGQQLASCLNTSLA